MKKTHIFPDVIYIPYDPADEINIGERRGLVESLELENWRYIDSCKVDYYGEPLYFWVLERRKS